MVLIKNVDHVFSSNISIVAITVGLPVAFASKAVTNAVIVGTPVMI